MNAILTLQNIVCHWSTRNGIVPNVSITNLSPATTYQYQLRTSCNGTYTAWGTTKTFVTGSSLGLVVTGLPTTEAVLMLHPNPATDALYLRADGIEKGTVSIRDLNGRLLQTQSSLSAEAINIGRLPQGIYLLSLNPTDGQPTIHQRFIKL